MSKTAVSPFTETAMIYLIEKDRKNIFYGNDSSFYPEEVWQYLRGKHLDLISLDSTMAKYSGGASHMGIKDNVRAWKRFTDLGCVDQTTKVVVNHFSHNGQMTHKELEEIFFVKIGSCCKSEIGSSMKHIEIHRAFQIQQCFQFFDTCFIAPAMTLVLTAPVAEPSAPEPQFPFDIGAIRTLSIHLDTAQEGFSPGGGNPQHQIIQRRLFSSEQQRILFFTAVPELTDFAISNRPSLIYGILFIAVFFFHKLKTFDSLSMQQIFLYYHVTKIITRFPEPDFILPLEYSSIFPFYELRWNFCSKPLLQKFPQLL